MTFALFACSLLFYLGFLYILAYFWRIHPEYGFFWFFLSALILLLIALLLLASYRIASNQFYRPVEQPTTALLDDWINLIFYIKIEWNTSNVHSAGTNIFMIMTTSPISRRRRAIAKQHRFGLNYINVSVPAKWFSSACHCPFIFSLTAFPCAFSPCWLFRSPYPAVRLCFMLAF